MDNNFDSLDEEANLYNHVVVGINTHRSGEIFRIFDTVLPAHLNDLPTYHVGDAIAPMDVAYMLTLNGQMDRCPHIIYTILTNEQWKELLETCQEAVGAP